jgi:hypothetical protein
MRRFTASNRTDGAEKTPLSASVFQQWKMEAGKPEKIKSKENKTMKDKRTLAEIFSDIADDFYMLCLLSDDLIEAHKMHARAVELDRLSREAEGAE